MHSKLVSVRDVSDAVGSWSARIGVVRVEFGAGALARLGELAAELGGRRAMLVTECNCRR